MKAKTLEEIKTTRQNYAHNTKRGRPRLPEEEKRKSLTFTIMQDTIDKINNFVETNGILNKSALIQHILDEFLKKEKI